MSTALSATTPDGPSTEVALAIAWTMEQLKAVRTFIKQEFVEGTDYGKIPGCGDKPTLFLPGAQKTAMYFNCYPTYKVRETNLGSGHVSFRVRCLLISRASKEQVGEGVGSCSTMEKKYRWRGNAILCPSCGKPSIFKSKNKPEYYCWKKKDGCGAVFPLNEASIKNQGEGSPSENPDLYDLHNTVLKMGKKRAAVDAAMTLGCLSELFTQEIIDVYAADDVWESGRIVDGEIVAEYVPEPLGPAVPHNDNFSGHGKTGTFASAEQVIAFNKWLDAFLAKANEKWAQVWEARFEQGLPVPVKIDPLLNPWKAKGHLLKFCVESGLLDPAIVPEDAKAAQKDKLVAIPYHRSDEDRARIRAEMSEYAGKQKTLKETAIFLKNPDMAPEGWLEEYRESIAPKAEDASQDEYVAPEAARKQTKAELANAVKARLEYEARARAGADKGDAYEEPEA